MSYLERYNWRIKVDGTNLGEALRNNTHYMKNKKFTDATTYRKAKWYLDKGTENETSGDIDIRVVEIDRMGSIRNILFKLGEGVRLGTILEFDNDLWLAYDTYGSLRDDIKMRVSKINDELVWKDRAGKVHKVPSISTISALGSSANSNDGKYLENAYNVHMPEGKILVFVELTEETKTIELKQRFIIGSKVYNVVYTDDVTMIDKDYHGVLKLILEVDLKYNNKDDFANSIAYNESFELDQSSAENGDKEDNGGDNTWGW